MHDLLNNSFFTGAGAIAILVGVLAAARRYLALAISRLVVEVEVREWDLVMSLDLWLADIEYGKRCRKLSTRVLQDGGAEPTIVFAPGMGLHLFRYKGVWVIVNRQVEKEENVWNRREFFSVRVFGSRSVATKLIEDAKAFGAEVLARQNTAFISNGEGGWRRLTVGAPRRLSSVVLPGTMAEDLLRRCVTFLASGDWYRERGIPWRFGLLLEGPPGTGKTATARSLAAELQLPFYVLDLTAEKFSDRHLLMTFASVPAPAMVVIEDYVDAQIGAGESLVTLPGLLNAVDGPLASEGRILVVTTNAVDEISDAFQRPGRLDIHRHLGYATSEQVARMFLRFFPGRDEEAAAFARVVPDRVIAPALIQEHLVARADDPARAVAEAQLLARPKEHSAQRATEAA